MSSGEVLDRAKEEAQKGTGGGGGNALRGGGSTRTRSPLRKPGGPDLLLSHEESSDQSILMVQGWLSSAFGQRPSDRGDPLRLARVERLENLK
jgi:hypothetical protein